MAEDPVHDEEPVPTRLSPRDHMLGRKDPDPWRGGVPEGGPTTNCPPPIAWATTARGCLLTSNSRFGGKTGEDHPDWKTDETMTTVKGATGVTIHLLRAASTRVPFTKEVISDAVQLTGRWRSMLSYLHPLSDQSGSLANHLPIQTRRGQMRIGAQA